MPRWYPGAKSEAGGQKSWKCSWLDQVEQTNGWLDQVGETGWEISDCQASELGRYAEGREEMGRKLKFGTRVAQRQSWGGQKFWGWPGVQEPLWERCWRQSCFSAIFLFKALVCSTASKFFASESPRLFSWVRQYSSFWTPLSSSSLSTSSFPLPPPSSQSSPSSSSPRTTSKVWQHLAQGPHWGCNWTLHRHPYPPPLRHHHHHHILLVIILIIIVHYHY